MGAGAGTAGVQRTGLGAGGGQVSEELKDPPRARLTGSRPICALADSAHSPWPATAWTRMKGSPGQGAVHLGCRGDPGRHLPSCWALGPLVPPHLTTA